MSYSADLLSRIYAARQSAQAFFSSLATPRGYRYTLNHNLERYPAGLLYGTWACLLGLRLINPNHPDLTQRRQWAIEILLQHRLPDGAFFPAALIGKPTHKSVEYNKLHCTNYALGALLELDPGFDFRSSYMDRFIDGDYLARWLEARSLLRPWEEGNNIVNVASYLALCDDRGVPGASERLAQMLEWHHAVQNPRTGGFDLFPKADDHSVAQSLAGAVHNFHLHHYLKEPLRYEAIIAAHLPSYLLQGALSACESLDYVELAIRTLPFAPKPQELVWALLAHAESLLAYQRPDGGWLEAGDGRTPTTAAGYQDAAPASCSYATWFRLCSLGMISIVLLGDNPANWQFRRTLGMGYAPENWPSLPREVEVVPPPARTKLRNTLRSIPTYLKKTAVAVGMKLVR